MSVIVLSGYYGAGNTGDEIILAAMLQALRHEVPAAEMVVLSANPDQTAARYGVAAVHRGLRDLRAKIRLLRRADLLLSGGGGLLQDAFPRALLPRSILYYLSVCLLAKLCGCRVMFYAQGVGPIHGRLARLLVRLVADRVDRISVRDPDSADLLRQIGIRRPPVHITADPALAWQPGLAGEIVPRLASVHDPFVISVRPWPGGEAHLRAVAGTADRAVRAWGATPVLLPFAAGADTDACRRVREFMTEGERAVILPELPPAEIYGVVAGASLVLGMRLHSLILAAMAGVPLVGLAYDPKVASFLRRLALEDFICPLEADAETIWRILQAARERRAEITATLADRLPALRERALATAQLARGLL